MSDVETELRSRFGNDLLLPAPLIGGRGRTGGYPAGSGRHGAQPGSLPDGPTGGAGLVAAPASPDQLAELMSLCSERGWRVHPVGGGTWSRPSYATDGLVVTTQRMTGIIEHEPEDLVAGVRAGTTLDHFRERLGGSRQFLPLDPPALPGATIGATVALRCAGPLRAGYGTPRDLVLGLELVTGDGRLLRFGGRVVKNVAGYDGVRLLTGSRGRLGIITAVFVRVRSQPRMDRTLAMPAASAGQAATLALACRDAAQCEALEILSPGLAGLLGLAGCWHVLARLHGSGDDVRERYERLLAIAGCPPAAPGDPSPAPAWDRLALLEARAAPALEIIVPPGAVAIVLQCLAGHAAGWATAAHATEGVIRAWPLDEAAHNIPPRAMDELHDAALTASGTLRWLVPPAHAAGLAMPVTPPVPDYNGTPAVLTEPDVPTVRAEPGSLAEARAIEPVDDPVALLTRRIAAAFDPAGILAGEAV